MKLVGEPELHQASVDWSPQINHVNADLTVTCGRDAEGCEGTLDFSNIRVATLVWRDNRWVLEPAEEVRQIKLAASPLDDKLVTSYAACQECGYQGALPHSILREVAEIARAEYAPEPTSSE